MTLNDPFTGEPVPYLMPGGGRGYSRVPSLISVWSTAPFLQNNALGPFDGNPSVASRVKVFETSMEQLLWPAKRPRDPILGHKLPGTIDRTSERSFITIPADHVPGLLQPLAGLAHRWFPRVESSTAGSPSMAPAACAWPMLPSSRAFLASSAPARSTWSARRPPTHCWNTARHRGRFRPGT